VLRPGFDEGLLHLVTTLAEVSRVLPEGAQRQAAGILGHLLARVEVLRRLGSAPGRDRELLMEACQLLLDPENDTLRLESIAEELGVSYSWFRQAFRRHTGLPPQQFRQRQRLTRACQLLADTPLTVAEIAKETGFRSLGYFSRMFKKETGLSPTVWRQTRP
jgi:AraC-like DNA-binding protein